MPLILAIEPDRRQAAHLTSVVHRRLRAELILVDTTERALDAIGNRVPDLVLVPALLSPQDDAALATALRVIAAAADVQMLTIPVLGASRPHAQSAGFLGLRRGRSRSTEPEGCDPTVFAEQIASYLERAAEERANLVADTLPDDTAPLAQAAVNVLAARPRAEATTHATATAEAPTDLAATVAEAVGAEPPLPDAADESVSIAVEEAVRALFSNMTPEPESLPELALTPTRELPAAPLGDGPPSAAAAEPRWTPAAQAPSTPAAQAPSTSPFDEFMAVLEDMSLPVIEASEGGDWAPPTIEESVVDEESEVIDIELAAEIEGPAEASEEARSAAVEILEREAADAERARFEGAVADVAALEALQPGGVGEPLDGELWMALGIGNAHTWPGLEGLPAESTAEPVPTPAPESVAPARPESVAPAAKGEREWVELIESLRHDVERLRAGGKPAPRKPSGSRPARSSKMGKPIQDEWGFFDPEQCGFAALLAKLDDVTKSEESVRA